MEIDNNKEEIDINYNNIDINDNIINNNNKENNINDKNKENNKIDEINKSEENINNNNNKVNNNKEDNNIIIDDSNDKNLTKNNIDNNNNNIIEKYLQEKYNIFSPILIITYKNSQKSQIKLDYDDYYSFLSNFGTIKFLEILNKNAIVYFNDYISAYTCYKYFENDKNYKENEKENYNIKWFQPEDENLISILIKKKIKKYSYKEIFKNVNQTMMNNYINKTINCDLSNLENTSNENSKEKFKENLATNTIEQFGYYSHFSLSKEGIKEFQTLIDNNIKKNNIITNNNENNNNNNLYFNNTNNNNNNNYINNNNINGKYICKFYVKIQDKDFDVCKRLIGAKGSNLKRIIDYCSKNSNGTYLPDAIKIKLRGKGSEFNQINKETDEPLNICVSSIYVDKYRKACSFVYELIINVYEEYKRYCERNSKTPMENLTVQKIESISTRKNTSNNNNNINKDKIINDED